MIDDQIVSMITGHPLIIVGTCDRALVPCASRAFGARVFERGRRLDVLITRQPSPRAITNIEQTGRVAVTFTQPENFISYQVKGRVTACREPDEEDRQLAAAYCETILKRLNAIGVPTNVTAYVFLGNDVRRVSFDVDDVFLQTPGKNAGQRI